MPPRKEENYSSDSDSESSSSTSDYLHLTTEDGWQDLEPDVESQPVVDLFSDEVYPDARSMLAACKEKHAFDFIKIKRDLNLEFLDTVKLVNYIRSEVKAGNTKPDCSSVSCFEDDKYLMPVLEDDALLYNLEDLDDGDVDGDENAREPAQSDARRVRELEAELERIRGDFAEYRLMVKKTLDKELEKSAEAVPAAAEKQESSKYQEEESGYFKAYSYNCEICPSTKKITI